MRKIVLLCAAGMSTSLLVTKMNNYCAETGYDAVIAAYPVAEAAERGKEADIILLGPQVRFQKKQVSEAVSCPVDSIDMRAYGMMDGKAAVEQAKKILGD